MFHSTFHVPQLEADLSPQYLAKIQDNNSPHLPTSPISPPSPHAPEPFFHNPGVLQDGSLTRDYCEKLAQNNSSHLPHALPLLPIPPPSPGAQFYYGSPTVPHPQPAHFSHPGAPHHSSPRLTTHSSSLNEPICSPLPPHPPPQHPHQPTPHPATPHPPTPYHVAPLASVTAAGLAHPQPSPSSTTAAQLGIKFSATQGPPGSPTAPVSLVAAPKFFPSGRRRALLVGINYHNTSAQLKGCVTDVNFLYRRLTESFGFQPSDYVILADEPTEMQAYAKAAPTRANILHWLNWLVSDTRPGDSLWFSFSGHGSQTADLNGDEIDCLDEVILPVDHAQCGFIVDDQLREIASRICPGSRLTVLIDSCHSGTALDLPFQHDVFNSLSRSKAARTLGRLAGLRHRVFSTPKRPAQFGRTHRGQPTCGEILLFSGCMDNQKSADTPLLAGGVSTGAMTYALYEALQYCNPTGGVSYSYLSLLKLMRDKLLASRMTQTPQFSTSCPFDLNAPFML